MQGIRWAGDNWIPPKLFGGTYQVKGKIVKDLHPVEVALLLEMPLPRVVAIMLEGLKRQGIIEVVTEDPLQIKILTARKAEHEYEELFLQSFDTHGAVLSGLLADFFEKVLAKLQEKIWDCDIDATKEYYRKKLEKREETEQDRVAPYYWYWSSYRWIYWNTAVYSHVHLPHDFSADYQDVHGFRVLLQGLLRSAPGHHGRRGGLLLGLPQRLPFRMPPRMPFGVPLRLPFRMPFGVRLGGRPLKRRQRCGLPGLGGPVSSGRRGTTSLPGRRMT